MASRRRARAYAVQALYHADLAQVSVSQALNGLWSGLLDGEGFGEVRAPHSKEVEFAQALALGVDGGREELDALIERSSTNWRLSRMPVVDRNILRLAAFELSRRPDIPPSVSINEAVELAKEFGTKESRAFVNGIVDRIARHLGRLPSER